MARLAKSKRRSKLQQSSGNKTSNMMDKTQSKQADHNEPMTTLLDVMRALRHPQSGCPWDLEQDYHSILPHTIEEVYEVADAIERNDFDDLRNELGDLLFQIVFYAQLAAEQGRFDFNDIANSISQKLVRRHPHVFATNEKLTSEQQTRAWEDQKAEERAQKATRNDHRGRILDDIPLALPGVQRAMKIQKRASRVGFDWSDPHSALEKVDEELAEVRNCLQHLQGESTDGKSEEDDQFELYDALEDEIGDLMFSVVNSARMLKVDPERAIRRANHKFTQRFNFIEDQLHAAEVDFDNADIDQLESLWLKAKTEVEGSGRKLY